MRFVAEFRVGKRTRLDVIVMFLTANLFRGNKEKTLALVRNVLNAILDMIQTDCFYGKNHLVCQKIAVQSNLTWRLHLMGTIMQLMSLVSVLSS